MNNLDKQYQQLLQDIIDYGVEKKDRTGTGTKSIFGYTIRHNMKEGFPLLTTKKMAWKTMVTELLWFLRGDTNIKFLVENGCHIWDGDAYKNYVQKCDDDSKWMKEIVLGLPFPNKSYGLFTQDEFINKIKTDDEFAKKWGDLGPIYGKQWRDWEYQYGDEYSGGHRLPTLKKQIDQISNLINELKTNPDSRRLMVSAWNVGELDQMVLPPCHYGFQVYTRELSDDERAKLMDKIYGIQKPEDRVLPWLRKDIDEANVPKRAISLMWNQRSVDTFLGLPFNIASYGLLLTLLGKLVNMIPEQLIGNLGDTHLYLNHIEQATEQKSRQSYELPWVKLDFEFEYKDGHIVDWENINVSDLKLMNYMAAPTIKAPLSN